jgi:hypothetical protein
MRRAPAEPVRAGFVRKWCAFAKLT